MQDRKPAGGSSRVSRINRYIFIVILLWIATTVALLLKVHPVHAHARKSAPAIARLHDYGILR